jgi:DNA-binding SARP family transcriptional activator
MLEISLFGDLSVRRETAPVALPQSRKTRALLAYLILNEGWHRRERLCEIFWQIPDDPRQSLRWSLSKLRGVVNDEAVRIESDRERVAFARHGGMVDFLDARNACDAGLDDLGAADLERLAELTRGAFLDGLELSGQPDYEIWRMAERERARRLRLDILRALIDRSESDPGAQADRLSEAVAIEPYDPDLHHRLVAALMRAGRTKEAKRQKDASEAVLAGIDGFSGRRLADALSERPIAATANPAPPAKREEAPLRQEVRFCQSRDGTKIAWASVGKGPPIVKTANWLNHLEFDWESPVWRHVFRGLSPNNRFIRYDSRGNGLSDWTVDDYAVDTLADDLEAVVEASGAAQFSLLAISQGCAIADA